MAEAAAVTSSLGCLDKAGCPHVEKGSNIGSEFLRSLDQDGKVQAELQDPGASRPQTVPRVGQRLLVRLRGSGGKVSLPPAPTKRYDQHEAKGSLPVTHRKQ